MFNFRSVVSKVRGRSMSSGNGDVVFDVVNGKGVIRLNRPKALNALNHNMVKMIHPVLQGWNDSGKISMVMIEGEGGKAFCAGGDIRDITSTPLEKRGQLEQVQFFADEYKLNHLIGTLKLPYVALLNGITMGGGVGLSVHGKYRVATGNTVFAMPETGIGLFPDVGGTYFMPRLRGELGMYLALVGHRLKGSDVLQAGIATHACQADQLPQLRNDLLESSDDIDAVLQRYTDQFPMKPFSLEKELDWIDEVFSAPTVEDILAKLQALPDNPLAAKTVKIMAKLSPTSMKITHRQMTSGKRLKTLKECLEMEMKMVVRCCEYPDFYEGVRALLVDKDNSPKWNPKSVQEVNQSLVDKYFQELPSSLKLKL